MVKDPAFLKDAEKRHVPIKSRTAAEIAEWVEVAKKAPQSRYDALAKIIGFKKMRRTSGAAHHSYASDGSVKLVEERLRLFQVGGIEALGEPTVYVCKEVAS